MLAIALDACRQRIGAPVAHHDAAFRQIGNLANTTPNMVASAAAVAGSSSIASIKEPNGFSLVSN